MADYAILTDVGGDLPDSMAKELGIIVLPMSITLGEKVFNHYADFRECAVGEFYGELRAGITAGTAAIPPAVWGEAVEEELKQGRDALLMPFSREISATYANAVIAAEELRMQYPEKKIIVVDTRLASSGSVMGLYLAAMYRREGNGIEETAEYIVSAKKSLNTYFTVDDLAHLRRGGRISATTAVVGSALGIKPMLQLTPEGKLESISKARGRKKSHQMLLEYMEKLGREYDKYPACVAHSDCFEEAEDLAAQIRERFGTPEVFVVDVGPVIGAHLGVGAIVLSFYGIEQN